MANEMTKEEMKNMTSAERKAYAIKIIEECSNFVLISSTRLNDKESNLMAMSSLNCNPQTLVKFIEIMKEMGDDLQVQLLSTFQEHIKEKRNPILSGKAEDVN